MLRTLSHRETVAALQDVSTSMTSVCQDGCLPTDVTASSFPSTVGHEVCLHRGVQPPHLPEAPARFGLGLLGAAVP